MKMIEPKQVQLIHIQKAQLGLSQEEYEAAIAAQTRGRESSSKNLTYSEADALITYFSKLGAKIRSNPSRRKRWVRCSRKQGNVVGMPSRAELNMIDVLVKKVPWRIEDGYRVWLNKHMNIRRIATAEQAEKVIEGLKGLLKHSLQGAQRV